MCGDGLKCQTSSYRFVEWSVCDPTHPPIFSLGIQGNKEYTFLKKFLILIKQNFNYFMQDYVLGKDVLIYFKWDVGRRYVVWRMVAGQEPGMEEEHGQEEEAGHAEVPISCFQVGCWKLVVLLCVVKKIN